MEVITLRYVTLHTYTVRSMACQDFKAFRMAEYSRVTDWKGRGKKQPRYMQAGTTRENHENYVL